MVLILFFMLVRWSGPQLRFDKLMALAWKVLLPVGLVNVVAVATWIEYGEPLARLMGLSDEPDTTSMGLSGWGVLIASCAVVILAAHAASKNRAEHDPISPDK
jgi:NADH-quinone oxidoreductase subunit H